MPWFLDVLAGVLLALGLYALVRFRMVAAPWMRDRYGGWARRCIWLLVTVLMVVVANLALIALRRLLHDWFGFDAYLLHEVVFAIIALLGGYYLVAAYVVRQRKIKSTNSDSDCGL